MIWYKKNSSDKYKKNYNVFSGAPSKSWNQQSPHSTANFCLRAWVAEKISPIWPLWPCLAPFGPVRLRLAVFEPKCPYLAPFGPAGFHLALFGRSLIFISRYFKVLIVKVIFRLKGKVVTGKVHYWRSQTSLVAGWRLLFHDKVESLPAAGFKLATFVQLDWTLKLV